MVLTSKRVGDQRVYDVVGNFRELGWAQDGSVLTPGRAIWTKAVFDELYGAFVERPDEGSRSFDEKLRDQLALCSDDAKQLMAELLAFHLLITRTITGAKKAKIVNGVLGWMRQPPSLPPALIEAFDLGFINPGTYYNTGRPVQLQYLITAGRMWKALPTAERDAALADPWRFKALLGDLHGTGAGTQRHALLHLLFPETYEGIVSDDHFGKILKRFSQTLSGASEDPDRQIQEVRAALTPKYGHDFDFYDSRLRPLWAQGIDPWADLVKWAGRLVGSPEFDASERTYKLTLGQSLNEARDNLAAGDEWFSPLKAAIKSSDNNLTNWRSHDGLVSWLDTSRAEATTALRALFAESGSAATRVQAFADTIRPLVKTPGDRINIASVLLLALDAEQYPVYRPNPFNKVMSLVVREPKAESEGKRYEEAIDFCDELIDEAKERGVALRDRLDAQSVIWSIAKANLDSPVLKTWTDDDKRAFLAWRDSTQTFAEDDDQMSSQLPSTDTEPKPEPNDWLQIAARRTHLTVDYFNRLTNLLADKGQIVLYGPPGTGKTFVALALAEALCEGDVSRTGLVQFHPSTTYEDFFEGIRPHTDDAGTLHYDVRPGPLARFAQLAKDQPDRRFVLVIDELNRANLPKVLGELLFLLEYRDREAMTLYRPEKPFKLPANLWFIATMNTVDRSVALIDAAMRRRFHFVPFYPDRAPVSDVLAAVCGETEGWVAELVAAVNADLVADLGSRDHQLGASHFIKCSRTLDAMEQVWRFSIEPLIEDQFYGQEDRVAKYRWEAVTKRFADVIPGLPGADAQGGGDDPAPA